MAKPTTSQDPFPQFERFDRDTAHGPRSAARKALVTMTSGGNFRLSARLAEIMGLKPGTGVVFSYDRITENWWLHRDDKHGIELREEKSGGLQFNSSLLRNRITDTMEDQEKVAGRMSVTEEPETMAGNKMFALLTSSFVSGRKRG